MFELFQQGLPHHKKGDFTMSKMVITTLTKDQKLTDEQKREILEARKKPIVFDEDSPHLTAKTYRAFREAASKQNTM